MIIEVIISYNVINKIKEGVTYEITKLSDSKVISCFYAEWNKSYYSIFFDATYDYSGKITIEDIEGVFLIIKNNYCNIYVSSSDNNLK